MGNNITEQIEDIEHTLDIKISKRKAIVDGASAQQRGFDAKERVQFDELTQEIDQLQGDLARCKRTQTDMATARPVDDRATRSIQVRPGVPTAPRSYGKELPKGTRFTRLAMALAAGRGSVADAIRYAKNWDSSTPDVAQFIERAVAGTTTGVSWASPLVDETNLIGEFIELLRPETLMGKLQGFRRVPFNIAIPRQTGGSTIGWVGEGAVKPVGELAFDTVTLGHNKVAGIVVITEELAKFSSPDAEDTVRRDLIEQTAQFLDDSFINPAYAGTPNIRPASVTYGATAIPASGTDGEAFFCDLAALQQTFLDANLSVGGTYLVMSSVQAARLALFRNALGQYEFPEITAAGGSIAGIPVVTSENVPTDSSGSIIALVKPSEILLADDGSVTLDASREATLDMNGGNTPNFSLWQRNCVAIRAERYITWKPRRAAAVAYISGAAYTPCASSP